MASFDFQDRRSRLRRSMDRVGIDAAFIPLSADLEYLTGLERRVPTFGDIGYAHDWVAGMIIGVNDEPVFILPRMMVEFDLPQGIPGDLIVVTELDDGEASFEDAAKRFGHVHTLGVGARTRAETVIKMRDAFSIPHFMNVSPLINEMRRIKTPDEISLMERAAGVADDALAAVTGRIQPGVRERDLAEELDHHMALLGSRMPSFDTGVWSIGVGLDRDADTRLSSDEIVRGSSVSFDFGAVIDGYCSDFGRTVHIGEPTDSFIDGYNLVIDAQAAGIAAVRPGATAAEVHHACRSVIVEAGFGDLFRHRTGHCIGLDVHERPYISEEDDTPLEEGMTFTIEPSLYRSDVIGARIEDVILCESDGGRKLNTYRTDLVIVD
jgi:Xaa-Pro aminopeptidase